MVYRTSAARAAIFALETREDGSHEGILQESSQRLPGAELWTVQWSREIDLRRNLAPVPILEYPRSGGHQAFRQFPEEWLIAILARIVEVQVLEEWLDVAADAPRTERRTGDNAPESAAIAYRLIAAIPMPVVVDDNPCICTTLRDCFESAGCADEMRWSGFRLRRAQSRCARASETERFTYPVGKDYAFG
jgi:hypothetical protein